ncbi:hypothetical protein GCM10027569_33570 [Flindersiella endophytica]
MHEPGPAETDRERHDRAGLVGLHQLLHERRPLLARRQLYGRGRVHDVVGDDARWRRGDGVGHACLQRVGKRFASRVRRRFRRPPKQRPQVFERRVDHRAKRAAEHTRQAVDHDGPEVEALTIALLDGVPLALDLQPDFLEPFPRHVLELLEAEQPQQERLGSAGEAGDPQRAGDPVDDRGDPGQRLPDDARLRALSDDRWQHQRRDQQDQRQVQLIPDHVLHVADLVVEVLGLVGELVHLVDQRTQALSAVTSELTDERGDPLALGVQPAVRELAGRQVAFADRLVHQGRGGSPRRAELTERILVDGRPDH